MAFDGIVTRAIVNELNCIIRTKIDKVHMPDKNTIILGLYGNGKHFNLNICIDSQNCRINLTNHSRQNPLVAPNFCMFLRKHLIGGIISRINMVGLERIVNLEIQTINEFNEIETKTLVIEIMGRHSNIILLNKDNLIIDSMRHIDSINSYRKILPLYNYTLPNSDKFDFLNLQNYEEFKSKLSFSNTDDLALSIANTFTGFSLSFIRHSMEKCNNSLECLYNYFSKILTTHSSDLNFEIIYKNDIAKDYILIEYNNIDQNLILNSFIDDFYFEKETNERFVNYRNSILKLILDVLKKYNNRLISINSKLLECNDMDKYKLYGELITANLYRLNDYHSNNIEIENYYDNNNLISIPLDIKYSPSVNAKMYFKKYSKLKNAFTIVSEQKQETEKEIDYIGSIIFELENATSLEDVQYIFEEISENIIFKDKLKNQKQKKTQKKSNKKSVFNPIKYEIDGYSVLVGRNNIENDWLTLSFANKKDIWFHVKNLHGSHVILQADITNVDNETLVKCAKIAAKHSNAKLSSNVPVDYCLVQFIKKPHSAKPGMVTFTNNKTINVNP